MPQDLARFTNLSPDSLVLIDANDTDIDWDSVTGGIYAWMVSIGSLCPKHCEGVELEDGDIELLLSRARLVISDRDTYQEIADQLSTRFLLVTGCDVDTIIAKYDGTRRG